MIPIIDAFAARRRTGSFAPDRPAGRDHPDILAADLGMLQTCAGAAPNDPKGGR